MRAVVNRVHLLTALVALLVLAWAVAILALPEIRFVVLAPKAKTGFEVSLALLRLFVALVLFLFPYEPVRDRLRWVALGFLITGVSGLGFGYLLPLALGTDDLNAAMYGSLLARSAATITMAIGLAPARAPRLSTWGVCGAVAAFVASGLGVVSARHWLPDLVKIESLEAAARGGSTILEGLTSWHWSLSAIPFAAACVAAFGAVRHYPGRSPVGWLAVAMVLMAGSQMHVAFWPSAYSPILTTASLLRLAFTLVAAVGGFFELHRVAVERAALLQGEREYAARLAELARLRADFTAMVAHELSAPIAAIRRAADLLAIDPPTPAQARAIEIIKTEAASLDTLVRDVQTAATIERDDFVVYPFPVAVDLLLADAVAFARTLPGEHPIVYTRDVRLRVLADPERIAQVLRNLLSNAAKYTPPGTPIELRAIPKGNRLRIEVADHGTGIHPDDWKRIFEKYGRGPNPEGQEVPGLGLGLYLSRQIVVSHGSDLTVTSVPGEEATFGFELQVACERVLYP
jgi:signal transduction histidine kinase